MQKLLGSAIKLVSEIGEIKLVFLHYFVCMP